MLYRAGEGKSQVTNSVLPVMLYYRSFCITTQADSVVLIPPFLPIVKGVDSMTVAVTYICHCCVCRDWSF